MTISLIIISYNSEDFIKGCLESADSQTEKFKDIIVVDNNSKDDTLNIIKVFNDVNLIDLDYNSGYSKAANIGISNADSDLCVISNADIIFEKDFVRQTLKFFDENDVDLFSPLMLRFDRETIDSAGQTYSWALYPKEIGYNNKITKIKLSNNDVFSVCGATTVFKMSSLERLKIGNEYYDEDFFIFWEDFDIGWRANLLGMKTKMSVDVIVYHYRSGTLKKKFVSKIALSLARNSIVKYHLVKNRYLTLIKNFRLREFWFHIPFMIIKDFFWVSMLIISSPKIIISLMKLPKYIKRAYRKRNLINAKIIGVSKE